MNLRVLNFQDLFRKSGPGPSFTIVNSDTKGLMRSGGNSLLPRSKCGFWQLVQCASEAICVLESCHQEGAAVLLILEWAIGPQLLGNAEFMNNLI